MMRLCRIKLQRMLFFVVVLVGGVFILKLLFHKNKTGPVIETFPKYRKHLKKPMTILLWTTWFGEKNWTSLSSVPMAACPVPSCTVTSDKSELVNSDAVVFHGPNLGDLPSFRNQDQAWVYLTLEAPTNTRSIAKYADVFNWTVMYRQSSDVFFPYFNTIKLKKPRTDLGNIAANKTAGILWVASNCAVHSQRNLIVKQLDKYFPVDSYGKCGKGKVDDKLDWSKYKFYLAFENSYCKDYITEKMFWALERLQIPIVFGGADYQKLAPSHSVINVADYESFKDLADYLKYLDKNHTAYNEYFEWAKYYTVSRNHMQFCGICAALHNTSKPYQVYTDIDGWLSDDVCPRNLFAKPIFNKLHKYAVEHS